MIKDMVGCEYEVKVMTKEEMEQMIAFLLEHMNDHCARLERLEKLHDGLDITDLPWLTFKGEV